MHVQTTTAGIDNFHRATPFHRAASDASKKRKSPTRALRNFWRLQFVVLLSVPAILVRGLNLRQSKSTSVADADAQTLRHLGSIFILRCDPEGAMSYSYRRASTGSSLAAFIAGHTPNTSPTQTLTTIPVTAAQTGTLP